MEEEGSLRPVSVRMDADQRAAVERLAAVERSSKNATVKRLLDLGFRWLDGERPPTVAAEPSPLVQGVPLAAADVGAGTGQLELIPGEDRPYYFRRDFLERKGWTETDPGRFAVYKLAPEANAWSMWPTMDPESVMLVDLRADRDNILPRSIWIIREAPLVLVAKRVTLLDDQIVLESDNRDPEFAPRLVSGKRADRRKLLVGMVVWFATDLEAAPNR